MRLFSIPKASYIKLCLSERLFFNVKYILTTRKKEKNMYFLNQPKQQSPEPHLFTFGILKKSQMSSVDTKMT